MIDYKALGVRIRLARRRAKMTQEQLAEKAGISTSYMGHVERGSRILSLETLVALAQALEVSLDELVIGNTPRNAEKLPQPQGNVARSRSSLAQQCYDLSNLLSMAQKALSDISVTPEEEEE